MVLITGVAGFIGMHVARRLLALDVPVLGADSMQPCLEPRLGHARLAALQNRAGFRFLQRDLADPLEVEELFQLGPVDAVIHLAAQTGVRQSAEQPHQCVINNLVAFANLLEACRRHEVAHLIYASSSSVYGANRRMPFSEHDRADHPLSLYAATKRGGELLAHSYSHLYGLPATGLRFFTVYGPWGRPDMAPMLFARAITRGQPIRVFNGGDMLRDFTYIDDVAEAVLRLVHQPARPQPHFDPLAPDPAGSDAPFRIYNVGNQQPVLLADFIATLEQALGREARKEFLPMQAADMVSTCADTRELQQALGWSPATPLATGVERFARWYQDYYAVRDEAPC